MKKNLSRIFAAVLFATPLSGCEKPVAFESLITTGPISEIALPQVSSQNEVDPAIVLSIRDGNIYLGTKVVALKSDLTRPDSYGSRGLVASLYTDLLNARQQWLNLYSGTTKKLSDLPLIGFNKIPEEVSKANLDAFVNPPLIIASDGNLNLTELIAIMATANQANFASFRILVVNRADGQLSQEELFTPTVNKKVKKVGSQPSIDFAVRILNDRLEFVDSKKMLQGPNGETTMSLIRRPTGLFDTQELETYLRTIKRQFPATEEAHIGGVSDTKLSTIVELLANVRCNHSSTGSCQNGYFSTIAIWPDDYENYILGPISDTAE